MMNLTDLAVLLLSVLLPTWSHPRSPDRLLIARSVAEAVELDEKPPLTGTKMGDVALMMRFARKESTILITDSRGECIAGDGGKALGTFQLQYTPAALACSPATAARIWLVMAHESVRRCAASDPDDRLALVTGGRCDRGRTESRSRFEAARADLAQIIGRIEP